MKKYELHSALPPAALREALEREARIQNRLHDKIFKIVLKWKDGNRFTLRTVETFRGSGPYRHVRSEPGRASASAGLALWYKETVYSNLLCAQVSPDGDGSVIVSYFKVSPVGCAMLWALSAGFVLGGLLTRQPEVVVGGPALCLGLLAWWRFHLERSPSSGELWDVLEWMVATVQPSAKRDKGE